MAKLKLRLDVDGDRTVYAGHVVSEPIEFQDAEAVLDISEEDARAVARRHKHVEYAGSVEDSESEAGLPDLSGKDWQSMAAAYDFEDVNGQSSADDIKAAYEDLPEEEQDAARSALDN